MQLTQDAKQALIFSLSRQASIMGLNAIELDSLGDVEISASAKIMKVQALQVRDIALYIDENL